MSQTIEANKVVIQQYFEKGWNQGKLEIFDEIIDSHYINHSPGIPNPVPGHQGLKPIVEAMRNAFPDLRSVIEDLIVTEDKIAVQCTMYGTHLGDLFGIAPTGKKVEVKQFQMERIVDGKIVEHWRQSDDLGMMQQLGQIP